MARRKSILGVAKQGDRLETLRMLRDRLATDIESCDSSRDLPSLVSRMQSVLAEIDELEPSVGEVDAVDEIAKRRSLRRSGPA